MMLCISQILTSLSFTLDYLEIGMRSKVTSHNKRVAYIAGTIGELCNFSQEELSDLYAYAFLHDNGIAESFPYMGDLDSKQLELKKIHCSVGEKNIASFPFFKKRENVILYHHERADGEGLFGVPLEEVDFFARIIHLADRIELFYSLGIKPKDIKKEIYSLSGIYFEQHLMEIFDELVLNSDFWMSLDDFFLDKSILRKMPKINIANSYADLIPVAQVYMNIIDGKSSFMSNHSASLADKAALLSNYYGFSSERIDKVILAAQLHDIGNLILANSILDKPGKLTEDEYMKVKYHTFYTRKALSSIKGFEDITEWASNHHEKLNGTGYPLSYDAEKLDFESRMFACLDVYQALTEERSYRASMTHEQAVNILKEMAKKKEVQWSIVKDIEEVFREERTEEYEL